MTTSDFAPALEKLSTLRIVVAGDLLLDHYIHGTTERTSPEAPVPVVLVSSEHNLAGGAANVARNIAASGAAAACTGVIGNDSAGRQLDQLLKESGVDTAAVSTLSTVNTIVKTRVVSQGQQIVRLDYEKPLQAGEADTEQLLKAVGSAVEGANAVILSDYGKGYLAPAVLHKVFDAADQQGIAVFVDPKGRDYTRYRGAFAITPNSREAHEATGISTSTPEGLRQAADAIYDTTGCPLVVITRGAEGLALRTADGQLHLIPTAAREVFDVTGAGDTFVAWITLGVAAGLKPEAAAALANTAAGIAVGRMGPAVVSPLDIRQALAPGKLGKKIISEADLPRLGEQLRAAGKRIVLANGCFDFLHAGHVGFLQQARALGDVLVVATNTDAVITQLKGEPRPIIPQRQREELLASIEAVDYVTAFAGETPHDIIRALRPDVLVKGSNYSMAEIEGADLITSQGGKAVALPIMLDIHTDRLIRP